MRGNDGGLRGNYGWEGIPLAPLRFAKGGFLAALGMTMVFAWEWRWGLRFAKRATTRVAPTSVSC